MNASVSYELLRTLAEEAFDRGDVTRAAKLVRHLDGAMLEASGQGEGREIGANEVSLIVPADRA